MKKLNVLIAILVIVLLGTGVYFYLQKNLQKKLPAPASMVITSANQTNVSSFPVQASPLSQDDATNLAIDAVVSSKMTSLSKDCIYAEEDTFGSNTITFNLREIHNKACGGDPEVSPMITQAVVNLITRQVTLGESD